MTELDSEEFIGLKESDLDKILNNIGFIRFRVKEKRTFLSPYSRGETSTKLMTYEHPQRVEKIKADAWEEKIVAVYADLGGKPRTAWLLLHNTEQRNAHFQLQAYFPQ